MLNALDSGMSWSQQQHLMASDGAAGDQFGEAVANSVNFIVAGTRYNDNDNGANAGRAR